jgi:CheY-like chemotaxis protein
VSDSGWTKSAELLDRFALKSRLDQEVARTRRHGGFISVAAVGFAQSAGSPNAHVEISEVADHIRQGLRIDDIVGWRGWATIVILMPDSDMAQALTGTERLLALAAQTQAGVKVAAGIATGYGEVEGGAHALMEAAEHALTEAEPGAIKTSDLLKGHPKVLVVDDDWTLAHFLAETISGMGWEGNPCTDSRDALERVREASYSALFVDLLMPGKSGLEVLRESLSRYPNRPCVLMSGMDAQHQQVMEAVSMGPVMFIRKPVSRKDLDTALKMFRSRLPGLGHKD